MKGIDVSHSDSGPGAASGLGRRSVLKMLGGSFALALAGGLLDACEATQGTLPATPAPPGASVPAPAGTLVVYSALNDTTNNAFVQAFQKSTPGITVSLVPLAAAGDLQARIRSEKNAPKADVFVGGSSEFHDPLGKENLLEAYKSPRADELEFKDPHAFWTGWYLGIFGLALNRDRFDKEMPGVKKPTTWDELLDPAWRGNLVLPDPAKTGGGYIFLATQVFRFDRDEERAMEFMKRLHANVAEYVGTSPEGIDLVARGKYRAGPNWSHDILTAKNNGQPLELIIPEPTGFEVGAVSIIKGGPNTPAARAFVDWVLSNEAGELNVRLSNRLSVREDVPPAPGAPTLSTVKLVAYDRAWASDNKDRLIRHWQSSIA